MKQWTKVKFESLSDERIQNLIKKEGMKGFGIYMMLFTYCDCYNGMSKETLELIVSKFSSRNFVNKILIEYGLFEVGQDGLVRACLRELTRAQARDSAEASASQLTGAGQLECLENKNETVSPETLEFYQGMKTEYPNVMSMQRPLTHTQYKKLVAKFGKERTDNTIRELENKPDSNTRYNSAYFTLLKWCVPQNQR